MTRDTCWTSIPRLSRSVEINTRLDPVRKLRRISSRSFWDRPACWRKGRNVVLHNTLYIYFIIQWQLKLQWKINIERQGHWTYHCRHGEVSSVHLPLEPLHFPARVAKDDGLLHVYRIVNITQGIQFPVLPWIKQTTELLMYWYIPKS